ncbi:MAG TPA: class I SAM-dependent methyltransferase [Thermoanaerobaculia bacterium]|jgi:ubiquinone/menaquinone biosynthesis C-methylase UbiE|nr:class I SAM-dependent methyltransferase [Thermoanaerobaculia bacterium]
MADASTPDLDWKEIDTRLGGIEPAIAREVFLDVLADEISPVIGLSRLLLAMGGAGETEELLASVARQWGRPLHPRLREMAVLFHDHREGCERVAEMLREHPDLSLSGPPEEVVATFRRFFDRSVARNEEASVAAYSLGDSAILARTAAEVVDQFKDWGLLGPERTTLEIGSGIGRMQAALSPHVAEAWGIDISPKMVEVSRRRCAGLPNVSFAVTSGKDLAEFEAERFDLVYAVDSFPYVHQAGAAVVETHFHEAARVLRDGGEFVILHFSYRDSTAVDRAEVRKFSRAAGFTVVMNGAQPFKIWDGIAFRMRKG